MAEAKKESSKKKVVSSKAKTAAKLTKKAEEKLDGDNQEINNDQTQAESKEVAKSQQKGQETEQPGDESQNKATEEKSLAKAGKRSAKAVKETEEKQAKEERKAAQSSEASAKEEKSAPKQKQRTAEDRLKARGKNYREAVKLIDKDKSYGLKEAVKLAISTSKVKFDASLELHVRLAVDPKQADQNVRDIVVLPAGTGKTVRIAVFGNPDDVTAAKKAGADIAAADEFLQQLDKGELNFDVLIATPSMMPKLGKYARVLGPKGLMPNPKSGTVTTDVTKAISEAKAGRVEYRVDSTGIVHAGFGKVSFGADKLFDNAKAILASIKGNKPAGVKGTYILSAFATSTMGPSVQLDLSDVNNL